MILMYAWVIRRLRSCAYFTAIFRIFIMSLTTIYKGFTVNVIIPEDIFRMLCHRFRHIIRERDKGIFPVCVFVFFRSVVIYVYINHIYLFFLYVRYFSLMFSLKFFLLNLRSLISYLVNFSKPTIWHVGSFQNVFYKYLILFCKEYAWQGSDWECVWIVIRDRKRGKRVCVLNIK
jgi:hypothetical protein